MQLLRVWKEIIYFFCFFFCRSWGQSCTRTVGSCTPGGGRGTASYRDGNLWDVVIVKSCVNIQAGSWLATHEWPTNQKAGQQVDPTLEFTTTHISFHSWCRASWQRKPGSSWPADSGTVSGTPPSTWSTVDFCPKTRWVSYISRNLVPTLSMNKKLVDQ